MFGELSLFKFQQSHELCWMYGKSEFPCRRSCVHDQEVDLTMALPRHLLVSPFSTTKIASTRRLVFNTFFFPFSGIWIRDDQSEAIYNSIVFWVWKQNIKCFVICLRCAYIIWEMQFHAVPDSNPMIFYNGCFNCINLQWSVQTWILKLPLVPVNCTRRTLAWRRWHIAYIH